MTVSLTRRPRLNRTTISISVFVFAYLAAMALVFAPKQFFTASGTAMPAPVIQSLPR